MKTIYLSGPISLGDRASEDERNRNARRFKREAKRLRESGYKVIDPTEVPEQPSWEDYMRFGMRAVADADTIAVLPGWWRSRGSRLEVFVGRELGLDVIDVEMLL